MNEQRKIETEEVGAVSPPPKARVSDARESFERKKDYLGVEATARASFGVYNGAADIEALARGIERVTRIFG